MQGDLKTTFIQKSLAEYMQRVSTAMRIQAQRMKIGVTDEGIKSLSYQAMAMNGGGHATLTFREYLRMVDMGAGRGHPLGGLTTMRQTLQSTNKTGFVQVKDKTRKPKKFYSKTTYGNLTWLQNQLLYGYTEETIAVLKKEMQN